MNGIYFNWRGCDYLLRYSAAAMFEIQELLPEDNKSIADNLGNDDAQVYVLCCKMLEILSRHGRKEALKSAMEPLPPLFKASDVLTAAELDLLNVKLAVLKAVNHGLHQDIPHKGPMDVDELEEAQAKKKNVADYLRVAIAVGLSADEAMDMLPGVVHDLFELMIRSNKNSDDELSGTDDYEEDL